MSPEDRRHIGEILILLFYAIVDIIEIWPRSHFWAMLSIWFVLSLFTLVEFWNRSGFEMVAVYFIAAVTTYLLAPPIPLPPPPEPHIGWLQPANEPTPPNSCDGTALPAGNSVLVIVGDNSFVADVSAPQWFPAIRIGSCNSVSMTLGPNGLSINAAIYATNGNLLGQIANNGYNISNDNNLIVEHSGDLSTLVVHDNRGDELLNVKYLNKNTIRIRGILSCPMPRLTTIVVTNDQIVAPGMNVYSHNCTVGGGGGFCINCPRPK